MKELIQTVKFKKDIKRYIHREDKMANLDVVLDLLRKEQRIPASYKPHKLQGKMQQYWECHIENDLLLLWEDPKTTKIYLARFGTHSEIFKRK